MYNYKQTLNSLIKEMQFTLTNTEAKSLFRKRGIKYTYSKETSKRRD
jgi:hypothetical protein